MSGEARAAALELQKLKEQNVIPDERPANVNYPVCCVISH